jgi:hypothetical protein
MLSNVVMTVILQSTMCLLRVQMERFFCALNYLGSCNANKKVPQPTCTLKCMGGLQGGPDLVSLLYTSVTNRYTGVWYSYGSVRVSSGRALTPKPHDVTLANTRGITLYYRKTDLSVRNRIHITLCSLYINFT